MIFFNIDRAENEQTASDEDVMEISGRLIEKNRQAYETLANNSL